MGKTITLSDESFEAIKHLISEEEAMDISSLEDLVGKKMFFRTVTYHIVGKVERFIGSRVQLSTASWIPDTPRFMDFIKNGELKEVEPLGEWFVNLEAVTDFGEWKHELPKEQL